MAYHVRRPQRWVCDCGKVCRTRFGLWWHTVVWGPLVMIP